MESNNAGRVCKGTLLKFHEFLNGESEYSEYQSMDSIMTDYISQDLDNVAFVEQEIFGFSGTEEDALLNLLDKID